MTEAPIVSRQQLDGGHRVSNRWFQRTLPVLVDTLAENSLEHDNAWAVTPRRDGRCRCSRCAGFSAHALLASHYCHKLGRCTSRLERVVEKLFRLSLLRPPVEQDAERPSIELAQPSEFQRLLAQAQSADVPRLESLGVARTFAQTPGFVVDVSVLPIGAELEAFGVALDGVGDDVSAAGIREVVVEVFGGDAGVVVASADYTASVQRLRDSVIAIKHIGEEHASALEPLTNALRDALVIERLSRDAEFPVSSEALRGYRRRSLRLPRRAGFEPVLRSPQTDAAVRDHVEQARDERIAATTALVDRYQKLVRTRDELAAIDGEKLVSTTVEADPGEFPPERLRPDADLIRRVEFGDKLSELTLLNVQERIDLQRELQRDAAAPEGQTVGPLIAASLAQSTKMIAGRSEFTPTRLADVGFRATQAAVEALGETAREVLEERGIALADQPLDVAVDRLERETAEVVRALDSLFSGSETTSIKRVGRSLVKVRTYAVTPWSDILLAGGLSGLLQWVEPDGSVPQTRGEVHAAGVADLLIVNQQLVGYEAADVAHIENVLRGETKSRSHTRRTETEVLTFREHEVTTSEERELESTSRFEMNREASKTIQDDASLKAGLTVSGKYGPTVEFSASAEGSVSRSKQEATKTAASFAQDVTERTANRITERVLERSSRRTTSEVTEVNEHGISNSGQGDNISGVYQWVNKVYEAQMFNYGIRTMFDFMVPEPASLLIQVLEDGHAEVTEIVKPTEFTLTPQQITETNYGVWVRSYAATDVEPPPEVYVTVAHDYAAGDGGDETDYNHSSQLAVPDGYRAIQGTVGVVSNVWKENAASDIVLGRRTKRLGGGLKLWNTSLDNERGAVPFALNTWRISDSRSRSR